MGGGGGEGVHEFKHGPVGGQNIYFALCVCVGGVTKSNVLFFWGIGGDRLYFYKMSLGQLKLDLENKKQIFKTRGIKM